MRLCRRHHDLCRSEAYGCCRHRRIRPSLIMRIANHDIESAGSITGGATEIVPLLSGDVGHVGGFRVVGEDLGHIGVVEVDFGEDFGLGTILVRKLELELVDVDGDVDVDDGDVDKVKGDVAEAEALRVVEVTMRLRSLRLLRSSWL
ncbi:hypothetical protein Dimus_012876 [Dionaea muscipula]